MTRLLKIIFALAIGALLASCRITVKIKEIKTINTEQQNIANNFMGGAR